MPSRRARRTVSRCIALAAAVLVAWGAPAQAHALLETSRPADGAALPRAPRRVALTFNEPVRVPTGGVRVFDDDGDRVDRGGVVTRADSVRVDLAEGLRDTTVIATYRVMSADGHPIDGALLFTVGDAGRTDEDLVASLLTEGDDPALSAAGAVARWLLFASSLLAAGGAASLLWVHDRDPADLAALGGPVRVAAVAGCVATVAGVVVQAAQVSGLGLSAVAAPAVLGDVAFSGYGASALCTVSGLTLLGFGVGRLWSRRAVVAVATGAALAVVAFALTGHTLTSSPRWLVVAADVAHTAAAAGWLGGLVLLWVALRRRRDAGDSAGAGRLVARFSALAGACVLVVTVAGAGLAWAEVRALRALVATAYGWTLLAKLALAAAVVAVAAYNRRRLVPRIAARAEDPWGRLRRTVSVEVVGLVSVVAVTAVLVNLVPASVAAGVDSLFSARVAMGDYSLDLVVDPNRAGRNQVHVYVLDDTGRPAREVGPLALRMSMPGEGIGPIRRRPEVAGPGHWLLVGPELSIPGQWRLEVAADVSRFERGDASVEVPVNP